MQSNRASEDLDPRNIRGNTPNFWKSHISAQTRDIEYQRNRLNEPIKNFEVFWIFNLTRPPGHLQRVPAASQKGHFQNRTKAQVVEYQENHLHAPAKNLDLYCIFGLSCHPGTPLKGPHGLPKGSFLELNINTGCWVSTEKCLLSLLGGRWDPFMVPAAFWGPGVAVEVKTKKKFKTFEGRIETIPMIPHYPGFCPILEMTLWGGHRDPSVRTWGDGWGRK